MSIIRLEKRQIFSRKPDADHVLPGKKRERDRAFHGIPPLPGPAQRDPSVLMFGRVRHLLGSLGVDPDVVDVKCARNPERKHIPFVRNVVDDSDDRNPLLGIDLLVCIPGVFPQAVPDADQKFAPAPDPHGKGVALRAVRRNGHGLFDKGIEPGNPDVGIPGSRIPRPDFNRAGIPLIEPPLQRHGAGTVFPVFLQMLFDAGLPGLLKIAVLDDRAAFTERHRAMPGGRKSISPLPRSFSAPVLSRIVLESMALAT